MLLHHILTIHRMWRDCKAATAIEYGLIAVAAVGVMGQVGSKLRNTFSNVSNNLKVS